MPASIYAWLPEEREDEERKQLLERQFMTHTML